MRAKRLTGGVAALLAVTLPLVACGSDDSSSDGEALRKTTVLLDWDPNPDHVALYTAKEAGYFEDAGLDVTFQPPSDPSDPTKLVSTGKIDIGISYEPETIISGSQGLDVVAVGALIPTALLSVMANGDSDVKSVADLAGHTIGTPGLQTNDAFLKTILAKNNIDPASVKSVNIGQDLMAAMVAGNVDATLGAYRNIEGVMMTDQGLNPTIIPVTDAGVPDYDELVIIAQASRLKSDPAYQKLIRDFLAGLARGNADVIADPASASKIIAAEADGYDEAQVPKMIDATVPLLKNDKGFGQQDVSDWQAFADWMKSEGLIEKAVTASDVVTNDYLPAGSGS
ncbi:ABC transporter substrate-binding protein [Frankia sp. CcI49]|uniref:ABC transporter substrate-binding protein n=1 Tax=unclassified Frankia TaxID=2632575 RepID=UPI0006CA4439|nr:MULTISPECIES: ABC transporter substrate-binding protein [unclassified Frankia]KPM56429.1 ABC transporter substrate-binding protein [Frankia sp. R43]ONH62142.1 ABC transporter substrate-binding protein [Frankia sp. CcI49]